MMHKKVMAVAKHMGKSISFKGKGLSYEEAFSPSGLLPGLTKRADQVAQLCFGYGLGAKYEDDEQSLLGSKVIFDEHTPDTLRLMGIIDVLFELMKTSPDEHTIVCDELMYD